MNYYKYIIINNIYVYSEIYLFVFSSNFILYFSNFDFLSVLILINPLLISLSNLILYVFSFSLFFICSFIFSLFFS